MIIDDLKLRPLKKIKGQKLTDVDCSKRRELAKQLLEVYSEETMDNAFSAMKKYSKYSNCTIQKMMFCMRLKTSQNQQLVWNGFTVKDKGFHRK